MAPRQLRRNLAATTQPTHGHAPPSVTSKTVSKDSLHGLLDSRRWSPKPSTYPKVVSDDKLGRSVDGAKMSTRDTLLGERVERHVRSLARNQLMSRARLGSTATIFEVVRPPVAAVAH